MAKRKKTTEKYGIVKCCDKKLAPIVYFYDNLVFSLEVANNLFFDRIEHCPWCGILLDTNLLDE